MTNEIIVIWLIFLTLVNLVLWCGFRFLGKRKADSSEFDIVADRFTRVVAAIGDETGIRDEVEIMKDGIYEELADLRSKLNTLLVASTKSGRGEPKSKPKPKSKSKLNVGTQKVISQPKPPPESLSSQDSGVVPQTRRSSLVTGVL